MLASIVWGSLGFPLFVALVFFVGARCFPGKGLAGIAPAVAFVVSWVYFLGAPDREIFKGNDWLLVMTPALAFSWGFRSSTRWRVLVALLACGVGYLILKPLGPAQWSLWLSAIVFVLWMAVGWRLSQGGDSSVFVGEFGLCSVAAFSLLAWLIVLWGSASKAQIMGGLITVVGVFVALYLLGQIIRKELVFGWMWIWFYWQALDAHFYMDVPWWFLMGPAFILITARFGSHIRYNNSKVNLTALGKRLVFLVFVVGGLASITYFFKPKSFY